MEKIDELSLEIKKYTKSYNDILVGMHNDMVKYKNDVDEQTENVKKTLELLDTNLKEIEVLRNDTLNNVNQIREINQDVKEAADYITEGISKFDKQRTAIEERLNQLEENFLKIKKLVDEHYVSLLNKNTFLGNQMNEFQKDSKAQFESLDANFHNATQQIKNLETRVKRTNVLGVTFAVLLILSVVYLYSRLL